MFPSDIDDLWDFDKPAETEAKFRALLPNAHTQGADYRLELLTQIARAQGLQRKFEEALATLSQVDAAHSSAARVQIRSLLERGRVLNSSRRQKEALPLFEQAFQKALKAKLDNLAVDAAHMVAIAAPGDQQEKWNLRAIALSEKSSDPKARNWLGSLTNNLGWTYHDAKQYDKALAMFEKALAFRRKQGKPGPLRIAEWCVARCLRSLTRLDESLQIQESLQKQLETAGEADAYVHEELAELYLLKHRSAEAKVQFTKAYNLLKSDPWFAENEPKRLARLKQMSEAP